MFMRTVFASFTTLLCTSFSSIDARIVQRDVVSPPITYPTAGTVWNVNERHNVTWDVSAIPPGTTNTGMIVLGFFDAVDPNNEHLKMDNPLAKGFPITVGRAEITVPTVMTRDSYILVLFGDSGNTSPKFTINNISITASPSSTVASSSSSSGPSSSGPPSSSSSSSGPSSGPASATDAQPSVFSDGSSTSSASQAISSTANQTIPGFTVVTPAQVSPASFSILGATSSASTTQPQPAPSQSSSSGIHRASHNETVIWISSICSLALVLGFALCFIVSSRTRKWLGCTWEFRFSVARYSME